VIVTLDGVRIGSGPTAELPETSLTFGAGVPTLAVAETGRRPVVLSLVAGGRMRLDAGRILVDGEPARGRLRSAVALVDTPTVGEPSDDVALRSVVREELGFARRPAGRRAVKRLLEAHGLLPLARAPFRAVPPTARVRLLTELAASRPGVEALVLTTPQRPGGAPAEWYEVVRGLAARGIGVLVVTTAAIADLLAAGTVTDTDASAAAASATGMPKDEAADDLVPLF
jgi:ABC-2 type transport system ATP-binding protein